MPTQAVNAPRTLDGIPYEGGFDAVGGVAASKELDNSATVAGTIVGPQRMVISALDGIIGPALSQPAVTVANTDTSWSFTKKVRHIIIYNGTGSVLQFCLDATATAGSLPLAPGAFFSADIRVTAVHLYAPSTFNINGASAGNIIIWGWM